MSLYYQAVDEGPLASLLMLNMLKFIQSLCTREAAKLINVVFFLYTSPDALSHLLHKNKLSKSGSSTLTKLIVADSSRSLGVL